MSDQQKQFYLYIDGQTVPVSEEVYREYRHYARIMPGRRNIFSMI